MHPESRVGENLLTGCAQGFVALGVHREAGILSHKRTIAVVQVDEVDLTEAAVSLHLTDHASHAVAVIGVVFFVEGDAIVAEGIESTGFRHIPAYTLVHDGNQLVGLVVTVGFHIPFRYLHLWEDDLWLRPRIAVGRGLQQGMRRGHVLIGRVAEVVYKERPVPIGHHRLMVVRPSVAVGIRWVFAVGPENLDVMNTNDGR